MSHTIPDSYSQATERLAEIIEIIEHRSCNVDELLTLTDEAVQLVAYCKDKLNETDKKVESLLHKLNESEVLPSEGSPH